jgi:2-phospho-L-lactate guanylyltransferase
VPVKALSEAKRRLSPILAPEARRRLVLLMLEDVLGVLRGVEAIERVLVVTPDASVCESAESKGAAAVHERRISGLNAAVRRGLANAASNGAAQALVIPADLPFATTGEIRSLLEGSADPDRSRVVLAPDRAGTGTNALLLAPPDAIAPRFGPGSFVEHLSQAVARRLDVRVVHLPGLAADIDEPRDVLKLIAAPQTRARYGMLRASLISSALDPPDIGGAGTK